MVIAAFPAAKLGALLLRQISKPITTVFVTRAKKYPFLRNNIIMPPAQLYNWCEVKAKMWILNLGKPVSIPVLNEAMAIELGSSLLSEFIIFVVAAVLLILEYNRSSRKEAAKEDIRTAEIHQLASRIEDLTFQNEEQRAKIVELFRLIHHLSVPMKPIDESPKVPIEDKPTEGPPSPPSPIIAPLKTTASMEKAATMRPIFHSSVVENANNWVRREMMEEPNQTRISGVLPGALNHIYRHIYKAPLTMC